VATSRLVSRYLVTPARRRVARSDSFRRIAPRAMASRKRGLTPSSQASMQWPLSMQEDAHFREASGPSPLRTRSITPAMTSVGEAPARLAGATLGQTSTHLPHLVQASSMSPVRSFRAASKLRSVMAVALWGTATAYRFWRRAASLGRSCPLS
jgi:hypothetical protein